MKKLLSFALALVMSISASAYDFMVDGLCYNINSDETSVTVISSSSSSPNGSLVIPPSVTYSGITYSVITIGNYAFKHCTGVTSVTIPNSVTTIGKEAFYGCRGLTSIIIPNSVTTIGISAFEGCVYLTSMTVGNSVISIGGAAFRSCSGLTSMIIPKSVTYIGDYAFHGCSGLASIIIPNSVTSIGDGAFSNCNSLTSVTVGGSTSIGGSAFTNCNITTLNLVGEGEVSFGFSFGDGGGNANYVQNLYIANGITGIKNMRLHPMRIYCFATTPPECDSNSFTSYTGALYVSASSLADYFTADYWCNFGNVLGNAVELSSITISQNSAELNEGDMLRLTATLTPSNAMPNTITWYSTNTSVATVSTDGLVNALAAGECDIIASCFNMEVQCHLIVCEPQIVITLDKHEVTIAPNQIFTLIPTMTPSSTELLVSSSNQSVVAARLFNGVVQLIGIPLVSGNYSSSVLGEATITVSSIDGNAVPDSCVVTLQAPRGDANGDGLTNVQDITTIIDQIMGNSPSPFVFEAADLNSDGEINVIDITALIDIIMNS